MKNTIELIPARLDPGYAEKWNVYMADFVHLYVNGEKKSDMLYRVGGFGVKVDRPYFLLMKHVESHYEDAITTDNAKKPHLESRWCIIDNEGVERQVFEHYKSPYLIGGVIYSIDGRYYNVETGESYAGSHGQSVRSEKYLFIENKYDEIHERRGVLQITLSDGSYVLHK